MSVSISIITPPEYEGWPTATTDAGEFGYVSPDTGALHIPDEDGGVLIRMDWKTPRKKDDGHFANLAEDMDDMELSAIADRLLRGIEADLQSRAQWEQSIANAVDLLGLKVQSPRGDNGASAAPLEGMSNVDHPLLLESVIKYQAEFMAEMLPADGPVKVRNDGDTAEQDELAGALQKDFNHYLTATAKEYYPDTARMAFRQGLVGCAFKKVYSCPLRKRPVSETVMAEDLIVSNNATDLWNAQMNGGRVTHRIPMQNMQVKRLMKAGAYRDVTLVMPSRLPDPVQEAINDQQGVQPSADLPEDAPHTIYECYTELELKNDGEYAPYVVTMDRDSRVVLSIRRNWAKEDGLRQPRGVFVMYSYVMGLGFYPIGLMHILANTTSALTAAWREFLDSGMFANFPGFLFAKQAGRQNSNIIRVAPGSGQEIETGGQPIGNVISPLPYKALDASFIQFINQVADQGRRLGGMAEIAVNEGRADVPVGTMLAMIEQQLKPVQGVFKMLHRAQAEEFALLRERFREEPEAFWRSGTGSKKPWDVATFLKALDDYDLVPMADPNTASQVARIMKAGAVFELAKAAPVLFKLRDTAARLIRMAQIPDGESLLKSPEEIALQGQGMDPKLSAQMAKDATEFQQKLLLARQAADSAEKERQFRAAERALESHDRAADRESRERVAQKREDVEKLQMLDNLLQRVVSGEADTQRAETERVFAVLMEMLRHKQGVERDQIGRTAGFEQETDDGEPRFPA